MQCALSCAYNHIQGVHSLMHTLHVEFTLLCTVIVPCMQMLRVIIMTFEPHNIITSFVERSLHGDKAIYTQCMHSTLQLGMHSVSHAHGEYGSTLCYTMAWESALHSSGSIWNMLVVWNFVKLSHKSCCGPIKINTCQCMFPAMHWH